MSNRNGFVKLVERMPYFLPPFVIELGTEHKLVDPAFMEHLDRHKTVTAGKTTFFCRL